MQKELKEEIRKEKEQYKNKIKCHFTYNNMRRVWSGMKLMSRYVNGNIQKITSVNTAGEVNGLNIVLTVTIFRKDIGRFMIF